MVILAGISGAADESPILRTKERREEARDDCRDGINYRDNQAKEVTRRWINSTVKAGCQRNTRKQRYKFELL